MLVATFGPTTEWAGKAITYDAGAFLLEEHGVVSAHDVMEYDAQGHLLWESDGTRAWVGGLAVSTPRPAQPVQSAPTEEPSVHAALVRCPTCDHEVSSQAPSCPSCGHPFAAPAEPERRVAGSGWVILAGGLLLAIGSFLPWATATLLTGTLNRNGMQLGQNLSFSAGGLVVLLLGIVTCVIGLSVVLRFQMPSWLQRSSIATGLVAAFVVILTIPGIKDVVDNVNENAGSYGSASLGFGLWVAILGGMLAVAGGVSASMARRASEQSSA